jgi:hypothetical protein
LRPPRERREALISRWLWQKSLMTTTNLDRTVHATTSDGVQVVRYGRAGKWYAEQDRPHRQRHIAFMEAVRLAKKPGSTVNLGLPGGGLFDARLRNGSR